MSYLMDERPKHGMKCYLDKTSALTSTDRTCCLFSSVGFSSTASKKNGGKKKKKNPAWKRSFERFGAGDYLTHFGGPVNVDTHVKALSKRHSCTKNLRRLHSCLILIGPTQVCIQRHTHLCVHLRAVLLNGFRISRKTKR